MTENNIKILKLSSGEEIICDVVQSLDSPYLSVTSPMKLNSYPKATRNGIEEALSLQRWIHFAKTNTYDIPKSQIIVLTEASYGLSKFYEYCVSKSRVEDKDVLTGAPTNRELDDIVEEQWDEEFGSPDSNLIH
jgi:hypothetical protein